MEPWQSWAAALAVGAGLAYYYTQGNSPQGKPTKSTQPIEQPQASAAKRRQAKPKGVAQDAVAKISEKASDAATAISNTASSTINSVANGSKKRKAGKESTTGQSLQAYPATSPNDGAEDDDKDWAAQLDARKKGVSLNKPELTSKAALRQQAKSAEDKSVIPAQASSMDFVKSLTAASPGSSSAANVGGSRTGDVSDMLEPRAAPPSVLRIVGEEKPKKQQAPRAASESQETKKQRQNKRKAEEQRLEREAQEKQRQALLENQRRTAREARGEPAKNGLAQGRTPATSAWSAAETPSTSGAATPAAAPVIPVANGVQLLDTFEPDGVSTASSYGTSTNGTTPATASSINGQEVPSEETQIEMLNEMNGWNEVAKGKKGKKKVNGSAVDGAVPESKSDTAPQPSTSSSSKPVKAPVMKQQQPVTNGYAALTMEQPNQKGHPDDSDWL